MSTKKQKQRQAPMPASSAGLLRFFEDETKGIKVRPDAVIILTVALIVLSIVLRFIIPTG